jgi:CHAD domain-containing protein
MIDYLYSHANEAIDELMESLERAIQGTKPHRVHRLRLGIKRVKSLLLLLEHLDPSFNAKKHLKPLDSLFRSAGLIRDTQVHRAILQSYRELYPKEVGFAQRKLDKELQHDKRNFRYECKRIGVKHLRELKDNIGQFCSNLDKQTIAMKCRSYHSTTLSVIKTLANHPHDDNLLHKLRILLKGYIFNQAFLLLADEAQPSASPTLPMLNGLQQMLGDWHDLDVLVAKLHEMTPAKDKLDVLIETIEDSKKELTIAIRSRLKELYQDFT